MLLQNTILDTIYFTLVGVGIVVIIWLAETIIRKVVGRKFKSDKNLPKDAINGINYVIRIIGAFIILFVFLSYFGLIDSSATLNLTTIFSTAIGFSSAIAIGNFVAGLYLLASRPYQVGDYLQIGNLEGFVTEIGLNYTKIQDSTTNVITRVPNKVAMNEDLLIYKMVVDKQKKDKKVEEKGQETQENKKKRDLQIFRFNGEKLVKYTMFFEVEYNIPPNLLYEALDDFCARWSEKFDAAPKYHVHTMGFRVKIRLVIACNDMNVIQDNTANIFEDLWMNIYKITNESGGATNA